VAIRRTWEETDTGKIPEFKPNCGRIRGTKLNVSGYIYTCI
jgi:hypothetical protein